VGEVLSRQSNAFEATTGVDAGDGRASEEHITNEQDGYVPNGVCAAFAD
jgi:hypothetical protein